MPGFTSILVKTDADIRSQPALRRGVELAEHCRASLRVIDVVDDLPMPARLLLPENVQTLLVGRKRDRLQALVRRFRRKGLTIAHDVLRGRPGVAAIREVLAQGHDLVLKDIRGERGGLGHFSPEDTTLLRKCPCPVWMVKPTRRRRYERILVAIDPEEGDEERNALSLKLLRLAVELADIEWAELHILRVWNAYGENLLRGRMDRADLAAYVQSSRERTAATLDACLAPFGASLDRHQVHVMKGDPGKIIPRFVLDKSVDLVVMGTVARTGIVGLVIGNTAEQVLGRIECSVLAVKPDGFVSPIKREHSSD